MAAKTPDSLTMESVGSMALWRAVFSTNDLDNGDTYASGLTSIIAAWVNATDNPSTQASNGVDVGYTASTGAITFYTGEDNRTGELYLLTKQLGG